MLVIVTRPQAQAAAWVAELQSLGLAAQALPLIAIAPPADAAPLQSAWRALAGTDFVMFVSANAVAGFFASAPAPAAWPAAARAGATGPGTAAALRAAGVPQAAIVEPAPAAPTFDSEALWDRVAGEAWAGRRVLVVRGEAGRDWFAERLRERGATVDFVAAYGRGAPVLDAGGRALLTQALDRPAQHLWLFSSSEALGHLRALAPQADWSASSAVASHPRIAQAARAAGFGSVEEAPPRAAAVAALVARRRPSPSIQSPAL